MRVYASAEMTLTDTNDGISVTGIDRYYMASSSSSGITVDSKGWEPDPQETNPISRYHWSYEVVNYSDGAKIPSKPAVIGVYGKEGIDAVTVSLSSEAHTFAGTESKAIASSITIDVSAFKGSQRIPTSIGTVTGGIIGQLEHSELGRGTTNNKLVINVTSSLNKANGTLSIPIEADGRIFNKVFSWSVAFKGNPGDDGKSSYTHIAYGSYDKDVKLLELVGKTNEWIKGYYGFINRNIKSMGDELSVNSLGLVGGKFVSDDPVGSFNPPSISTSEAQVLTIRGLLRAYQSEEEVEYLDMAKWLMDAYLKYYFPTASIPTTPDKNWVPHWMVNVNKPFKGREWFTDGRVKFTNGVARLSTPSIVQVYNVRDLDATMKYNFTPASDIIGKSYEIETSVVNKSNDSIVITLKDRTVNGDKLVSYSTETGPIIEIGQKCESYPVWRPLEAGEIACAVDTVPWTLDTFKMMFEITKEVKWQQAYNSMKASIFEISNVSNTEYFIKYGEQDSGVLKNGVTSYSTRSPLEDFKNTGSMIEIDYGATAENQEASFGTWVGNRRPLKDTEWIEVKISSDKEQQVSVYIDEDEVYDANKRWKTDFWVSGNGLGSMDIIKLPRDSFYKQSGIVWGANYGATSNGGVIASANSIVSFTDVIENNIKTTSIDFTRGDEGGWLGWAQYMFSIWGYKLPFEIKYKTNNSFDIVIEDSLGVKWRYSLPKTGTEYKTVLLTESMFTGGAEFASGDYASIILDSIDEVANIKVDYVGKKTIMDKKYYSVIGLSYQQQEALKIGLEYIKPAPSREPLPYVPYVLPFDFHLINYESTDLRGALYTGYQAPWIYQEGIFEDEPLALQTNLQFLKDSQDAYYDKTQIEGFFAPIFWWNYKDDFGDNEPNTFGLEGNWGEVWGGFQYRTFSDVAKVLNKAPNNEMVYDISMRFIKGVDKHWADTNNGFPTKFDGNKTPVMDQIDSQMVANYLKGLVRLLKSDRLTDVDRELVNSQIAKSLNFLSYWYVQGDLEPTMHGTWSPNVGAKEWYNYWGGEILDALGIYGMSDLNDITFSLKPFAESNAIGIYSSDDEIASNNPRDYTWSLTKGADGKTTYTWVRYADEKDGTGIDNLPAGKKFIGLAFNKTTPNESNNPNDYQWSAMYDEEAFKGVGLADKTETLSGTEIYTDKADDDAVVHVEVDGKSYQHAGSGKNLFIPTRVIDETMASQQVDNKDTLSPSGDNEKFYEISGEPNKQYTFTFNYKHTQGQEPIYVKFFYSDGTDDGKSQGALDKTTWTTKSITSKPNKTVIGIGYHNAEIEWIAGTLTESIPFSRIVINDNTKLASESYIRKPGVNGSNTYSVEYKWVNGVKTSETRNKKLTSTVNPVNEEYVQGTMDVVWKAETYSEPIKFSRTTIDDKNILPADSYIRKAGVDGSNTYSIEYKWVNGVKTSETRNKKLVSTKNPVNEEYVRGTMVVEWKQETSTETIAFTRVTQDSSDIYPNESYVSREGVNGSITYSFERKWVNGASTSETRNKVEASRKNAVNEIYIRGTKSSEWRQVTTYESIPYTTVRQNDNTIEIGTEVVGTVGKNGRIKVITEHEYVNNSPTGEKREVSRVTDIDMIPEVIKVGTKPKALVNLLEPSKIKVPNALDIQINGARKPVQSVDSLDIPLELMQWAANPALNIEGDAIQPGKEYTFAFKYEIKEGSVQNMKSTANLVWWNNKAYMDGELVSTRSDGEVPNGLWPTTPGVHTFVYQFGPSQASAGKLFMFRFNENHFTSPVKIWLTDIGLYEGHVQPFGEAGTPGTPGTPDIPDTDGLVPFRLEPDVTPSTTRTTIDAFANKKTYNLVTDFGAVGDGVTDNFTAMKNAILSSVSEPVNIIVPKGNFYYRGPDNARLEVWPNKSKGIRFIGQDGAVLLPDHNRTQAVHESYVMQLVFDEDTSIGFAMEGLTIDGINAPQDIYHTMPNATNVTVPTLRGISIEGAQDIVIHNSTFKNIFGGYTILATKYKQVDLSYVELDRCGGNAWTESFGGALYFGGQYGDATINIDNVHAEGYTDSRYPKLLGWIGIIFENGSVQLDNQSSWVKDQNTYFNVTNSSFLNYETGWHVETVAGNTYWNSDNVLYKVNNYAIVAALWGEIKEASNRIKTQLLPFGRTGIIKGMYYSEKEASKNENGLNDFNMYNSYVDVIDIPGFPSIGQTMSYGDSVHSKYYNTTFNNVPNGLVTNGSTTVVNSEINLAPGNPKTDYQLKNGEFNKPNVQKVSLTNTNINRSVAKIAAKGSNPAKVKNTGYTPPPLTKPLGPATLERES